MCVWWGWGIWARNRGTGLVTGGRAGSKMSEESEETAPEGRALQVQVAEGKERWKASVENV